MYDVSGEGRPFAKSFSLTLGLWHNYKQASLKVYETFLSLFFIRMYFHLVPQHDFYRKTALINVVHALSLVRLAYPEFKAELDAALKMPDVVGEPFMNVLQNLRDLCTFFIPVVPSCLRDSALCFCGSASCKQSVILVQLLD